MKRPTPTKARKPLRAPKVAKAPKLTIVNNSTVRKVERNVIRFYRANEKPYGAFSNLFPRKVEFEGTIFQTAEHAYQAGKAIRSVVREWILSAPSPALAAMAAHGLYTWEVVPNWAEIKFQRMRKILHAKFSQHTDLAELLLSTGQARLAETGRVDNAVNRLWGEVNGRGENMLGVMLMEIRDQLAKERNSSLSSYSSTKKIRPPSRPTSVVAKRKASR